MISKAFIVVILVTGALGGACGSSGMGDTPETAGIAASNARGAGMRARRPCTPSNTVRAPTDGLVTDFSGSGRGVAGRIFTYASPPSPAPSALAYTTSGGSLEIKVNAPPAAGPQLLGTVFQFDSCVDASAFQGVQFTVSGSLSGCSLTAAAGDVQHQDVATRSTFATGEPGSYPPQHKIVTATSGSAPRKVEQPFARSDIEGNPRAPTDSAKLISMLWQLIVPVAPSDGSAPETCTGAITIDDLRFYP